ncbi:hypothetical protein LDENG_00145160 [Lucifuga dentata]|nr:hypothetical protein LDENG_00145160 [Lucifuga dentata]
MMERLCKVALVSLLIMSLLDFESTWAKRGGGSSSSFGRSKGGSSSSSSSSSKTQSKTSSTQSKTSSTQAGNYPRQPQSPNRNPNPYPVGGSYPHPGRGGTNQGGYPNQNPSGGVGSYPGAGGYPNQNPGRVNPGGYPNQNPAGSYPAAGGYPNQNPARGNYPNQNPAAGGYPAGGGYPNQYPARGNYPNQNPAAGGYPAGGYPNQYPARGNYPNQYPVAGGYPAGGGYPVRGGNAGQGWGVPGGNPGGYPGGGYPNWNPNNKILSPRFGGGGGFGGYGMGGSPFSHSVQKMGYQPSIKSKGFAKKAIMAAGVGAVAGMAIGYGLGRFPRPHFNFRNPEEEYYYNNYMYRQYGSRSTDEKDFGRDYVYKPPPRAQSYDNFMDNCMNKTDLPKDQGGISQIKLTPAPNSQGGGDKEDDDTVSIEEIGYPALIEQVKARRCVESYMTYSKEFLQERTAEQKVQPNNSPVSYGVMQLLTSLFVLLSSMLLLQ